MRRPVQLRIFTRDPQRAAAFYAEVLGWPLPADGDRLCWVITPSDDQRLGIDSADASGAHTGGLSIPTVHVDDLDAATRAVVAAGGEILVARVPAPGWAGRPAWPIPRAP